MSSYFCEKPSTLHFIIWVRSDTHSTWKADRWVLVLICHIWSLYSNSTSKILLRVQLLTVKHCRTIDREFQTPRMS